MTSDYSDFDLSPENLDAIVQIENRFHSNPTAPMPSSNPRRQRRSRPARTDTAGDDNEDFDNILSTRSRASRVIELDGDETEIETAEPRGAETVARGTSSRGNWADQGEKFSVLVSWLEGRSLNIKVARAKSTVE
jgi:hypothetical protein